MYQLSDFQLSVSCIISLSRLEIILPFSLNFIVNLSSLYSLVAFDWFDSDLDLACVAAGPRTRLNHFFFFNV